MAERVTIAEIATMAGVSVPTVSKVINGRSGVSPETRERVRCLLEENRYVRRGQFRRKPAGLVDFVIREVDTLWATALITGAAEEAARAGVGLVVTPTHGRDLGNRQWLRILAQRKSDGVVLVVSRLQAQAHAELSRLGLPYVIVDQMGTGATASAPVIGAANVAGGFKATAHLLELGHRRIGIIAGDSELLCTQERLDGYRAALGRAGIPADPDLVRFGNFHVEGGRASALSLLDLPDPPTAIFAGSDQQAGGVYLAANERGLRIPQDLSVVGFDDVALCEWLNPPLTTVRQPLEDMAREATKLVLAMAYQGIRPPRPKVELATELVVRHSTAPRQG